MTNMGSRGTSGGGGITLNDGSKLTSSDMNTTETYLKIADFEFSDYLMHNDGSIVMNSALRQNNNPPAISYGKSQRVPRLPHEVSSGFRSSFEYDWSGPSPTLLRDRSYQAVAYNVANSSSADYYLKNTNRIAIQTLGLGNALAPTLAKYGFSRVGTVAPPGYMEYDLWEKKK